jgi:polar amino acid transport system substrate-binding protein
MPAHRYAPITIKFWEQQITVEPGKLLVELGSEGDKQMPSAKYTRSLRAVMGALALITSLVATSHVHAQSGQPQNLTPKGELRMAFIMSNTALVKRTPEGQFSGILFDLANALATKLGVPLHPIAYANIERYNLSIGKGEWDVALAPRDLSRLERLGFSEPILVVDSGYVTRPGSSFISADDVDRAGIKVAVAEHSPADGFLTRTLKKATIVRLPRGIDEVRQALTFGSADVYADSVHVAYLIAAELPGATVLVGRFNSVPITLAVPKSNSGALSTLNDFVHEAKHDGVISDLIKRAGLQGLRPAR